MRFILLIRKDKTQWHIHSQSNDKEALQAKQASFKPDVKSYLVDTFRAH